MDKHAAYDRLVGMIYEAGLAPQQWQIALREVAREIGIDFFHLLGWDARSNTDVLGVIPDPTVQPLLERYISHYAAIDPRIALGSSMGTGQLMICTDHLDDHFVASSEIYQDHLIPNGMRYSMGAGLWRSDGLEVFIGLMRSADRGPYQNDEVTLMKRLIPHLQRSVRIQVQLWMQNSQLAVNNAALDTTSLGVLALSATGKVLHANRKGEVLLRAGNRIKLRDGQFEARDLQHNAAFQIGLRETVRSGRPNNVNLGGINGSEHFCLTLTAVPDSTTFDLQDRRTAVLCLITEGANRRVATVRQLMELFRLSPAEARVARALSLGESLDEYAQVEGLKRSTVKSQLTSALHKTATRDQKDLIRLVLGVPAVRDQPK